MSDEVLDQGTTTATPEVDGTTLMTGAVDEATVQDETKVDGGEEKVEEGTKADPKTQPEPEVPEHYTLKVPDGETLDPDALAVFEPIFKEAKLSNEMVQKLVDAQNQQRTAALEKINAQWLGELKSDKEIGGSKLPAQIKLAQGALARFGTPELKSFLDGSKLGNHPELVRYFAKVGAAMSEGSMVNGEAGSPPIPVEQKMFPNTK